MMKLIRYRLVYNRKHQLNRNGQALVQIECLKNRRRIYLSTNVYLRPEDWDGVKVVNHPLASQYNKFLFDRMMELQRIEFEFIQRGKDPTLRMLRDALERHATPSASLRDFMHSVIDNDSSRCKSTRQSYHYLVNDIEKEFGTLTVSDVNYDIIIRYREAQRRKNLSENTIRGRLKSLRCLLHEAQLRDIIPKNPFDKIHIGNITAKKNDYLTEGDVRRIERISLEGKEEHVRDAFLFCVYTGCRWGDFVKIKSEEFVRDRLIVRQQKTGNYVELPIRTLFGGKALDILARYESVEAFTDIGHNTTANRMLKVVCAKAGVKKNPHWHTSRKTCTSTYRSILLMGSDLGGLILLSITRAGNTSDATGIKVYGKSNDLKLYVDSNFTIYMQSMSGHLTQPIAYHSGSNSSDVLYMNKIESLPSGVVELTVTNTFA